MAATDLRISLAVYPDGTVCISILHAPGDDPNSESLGRDSKRTRCIPLNSSAHSVRIVF